MPLSPYKLQTLVLMPSADLSDTYSNVADLSQIFMHWNAGSTADKQGLELNPKQLFSFTIKCLYMTLTEVTLSLRAAPLGLTHPA